MAETTNQICLSMFFFPLNHHKSPVFPWYPTALSCVILVYLDQGAGLPNIRKPSMSTMGKMVIFHEETYGFHGIYSYGHLLVITGYKWDYTFYKWGYKYL